MSHFPFRSIHSVRRYFVPDVNILISAAFSFSFFFTTSIHRFLQELFRNLIGRLPTYLPEKRIQLKQITHWSINSSYKINNKASISSMLCCVPLKSTTTTERISSPLKPYIRRHNFLLVAVLVRI